MKKYYLLLFFLLFFIAVSGYVFFFVPLYRINGIRVEYSEVKSEYKDPGINVYYRGKKYNNIKVVNDIDINKIGKYDVSYNIIIDGKTKKIVKRTVNVIDTESPIISLKGDAEVIVDCKSKYEEAGYESNDNYDGDITDKVQINDKVNYSELGTFNIYYTVKDSSNNIGEAKRSIIVKDLSAPVIELKRNKDSYVIIGNELDLSYGAIDNYDGDVSNKVEVIGEADLNKVGKYTITYKVSDSSNNTNEYTSTVNVQNKNTKGVPVLMYHWFYDDINGEKSGGDNNHNYTSRSSFEEQMKYLVDNNFYFPTWDELEKYIDDQIDLPEKSIILTDDDGQESFFRIALPICQKYKIPITAFVISDKALWREYVNEEYLDIESHTNSMHMRTCKGSWDGAAMCMPYEDVLYDLNVSVENIGHNSALAYPFGHYNDNFIRALKEAGIHMAFTVNEGRVKKGNDKYKLPRVRISRGISISSYAKKVN